MEEKRVSFYDEKLVSSVVPDQIKCARAEAIKPVDVLVKISPRRSVGSNAPVQERFRVSHYGAPQRQRF